MSKRNVAAILPFFVGGCIVVALIAAVVLKLLPWLRAWGVGHYPGQLLMLVPATLLLGGMVFVRQQLLQRRQEDEPDVRLRQMNRILLTVAGCALIVYFTYVVFVLPMTIELYKDVNARLPLPTAWAIPFTRTPGITMLYMVTWLMLLIAKEWLLKPSMRLVVNWVLAVLFALFTLATILVTQLAVLLASLHLQYQFTP